MRVTRRSWRWWSMFFGCFMEKDLNSERKRTTRRRPPAGNRTPPPEKEKETRKRKGTMRNALEWKHSPRNTKKVEAFTHSRNQTRKSEGRSGDDDETISIDDERFGRKVEGFRVMMKLFCREEERKMIRSMMVMVMREEAATVRKEKGKWEREWEWGFRVRKGNEKWH